MFATLKSRYDNTCINLFCFLKSEKGQGVLEYGLVITAVSLGVLSMLGGVGDAIKTKLQTAIQSITAK